MLAFIIVALLGAHEPRTRHVCDFGPLGARPDALAPELRAVLAAHAPEPSRASSDRLGRDGTRALLAAVKKAVPDLAEKHAFSNVFEGFAADLTASQLSRLRSLGLDVQPDVIHVAQGAREGPRGAGGADGRRRRLQSSSSGGAASAPPWPLDRLDQPKLPLDMRRSWTQNGSSVDVYIIDTGINAAHQQFAGRIGKGFDFVDSDTDPQDCNGHGTHCAGLCCGSVIGVAPATTIHALRTLDCEGSGYSTDTIAAMEWVANHNNGGRRKVVSMSLGGPKDQLQNDAVAALVQLDIVVVVAAGNDASDACAYSPASAPKAITVGSTASSDRASSFTNYGKCVDLMAPGSYVRSAFIGGPTAYETLSGTSMAAPLVSGIAALVLQSTPSLSAAGVHARVVATATAGRITASAPGNNQPNLLAQVPKGAVRARAMAPSSALGVGEGNGTASGDSGNNSSAPAPFSGFAPPSAPPPEQPPSPPPSPPSMSGGFGESLSRFVASVVQWFLNLFAGVSGASSRGRARGCGTVRVLLTPDARPTETSWTLRDESGAKVMGGDFADSPLNSEACLAPGDYTFRIYDMGGDGICCAHGAGAFELFLNGESVARGSDEFRFYDSVQIAVGAPAPLPTRNVRVELGCASEAACQALTWAVLKGASGATVFEGRKLSREEAMLPGDYRLELYNPFGNPPASMAAATPSYALLIDDVTVLSGLFDFAGVKANFAFVITPAPEAECYELADASDYRGATHKTANGTLCQRWTEHEPHAHAFGSKTHPGAGLGAHSFCRNPDHSADGAWCFTNDPAVERAPCALPPGQANCSHAEAPSALASEPTAMASSRAVSAACLAVGFAAVCAVVAVVALRRHFIAARTALVAVAAKATGKVEGAELL